MNYTPLSKTVQGYRRSNRVIITNEYNRDPQITFFEQDVLHDGDAVYAQAAGELSKTLTADTATTVFDLINPSTGEPLGVTSTYQDVQVLLYSLYFALASERDGASVVAPGGAV